MENCGKRRQQAAELTAFLGARRGARPANGSCAPITALQACSACAGDYEDPDRTAWEPDEEEPRVREDSPEATGEKFPADEG